MERFAALDGQAWPNRGACRSFHINVIMLSISLFQFHALVDLATSDISIAHKKTPGLEMPSRVFDSNSGRAAVLPDKFRSDYALKSLLVKLTSDR